MTILVSFVGDLEGTEAFIDPESLMCVFLQFVLVFQQLCEASTFTVLPIRGKGLKR